MRLLTVPMLIPRACAIAAYERLRSFRRARISRWAGGSFARQRVTADDVEDPLLVAVHDLHERRVVARVETAHERGVDGGLAAGDLQPRRRRSGADSVQGSGKTPGGHGRTRHSSASHCQLTTFGSSRGVATVSPAGYPTTTGNTAS